MSNGVARQSDRHTCTSPTLLHHTKNWQSDEDYVAAQALDSSWSTGSAWGEAAASKFVMFGRKLIEEGLLYHDDRVADFGGNDGYAANEFYKTTAVKPMVIDCEPKRLQHARQVYGLHTVECFLEDLQMDDKSIDWGFCSHTMEHTRDPGQALREMARVIKRGCYFVFPIENHEHAEKNNAHAFQFDTLKEWVGLLKASGWKPRWKKRVVRQEAHIVAVPV